MKRFFAAATLFALLIPAQLAQAISFGTPDLGVDSSYEGPAMSNYFPDAVLGDNDATTGIFRDYTDEAESTDRGDVIIGHEVGDALYFGLNGKFDGVSLDINTPGESSEWALEYWDGSEWKTRLTGDQTLLNQSHGAFTIVWGPSNLGDWRKRSIEHSLPSETSESLYFARFRFTDSEARRDATATQVGILKYNLRVSMADELDIEMDGYDPEEIITLFGGDNTIYASDSIDGAYYYALNTINGIIESRDYTIHFGPRNYVTHTGSITIDKATQEDLDLELDYSHKIAVYNELDGRITPKSPISPDGNCRPVDDYLYCALGPKLSPSPSSAEVSVASTGYVYTTDSITNRNSDSEAQISEEIKLPFAYKISVKTAGTLPAPILDASVKMGENLEIDCQPAGVGDHYCAVPVDADADQIKLSAEGYTSMTATLPNDSIRLSHTDPQQHLTFYLEDSNVDPTPDPDPETDGPDLAVDSIYMSGDELHTRVENRGDEDVNTTVKIKVYIDGALKDTLSSSSGTWLEAGGSSVYDLGSSIYGSKDDFDVEVCVDTEDEVDEISESNNCKTSRQTADSDKPDLYVDDLEIETDGDITFTVGNDGREDVDDDERVYIYVYVDGDREWTKSYDIDSSSGLWLEEGEYRDINVGELFSDRDEHRVRVCVDATSDIDEESEANNCITRELEREGRNNSVSYYCNAFEDMNTHWAADSVCELAHRGIVQGRSYYRYEPNANVTRAEFLKIILLNADMGPLTSPTVFYNDLSYTHWAYDYIKYATELGIVRGYNDGSFRPDAPVTRGEAVTMIMRLYGEELWGYDSRDINFSDVYTWDWYAYAVILAESYGIVEGYSDATFRPNNYLDRGEAAVIAERTDEALN